MAYIDANVLLRHFLSDNDEQSPRATALAERVSQGFDTVDLAETTLFEVVFTLGRTYKRSKANIAELMSSFLALPAVGFPRERRALLALDLFQQSDISFADAYLAALALESDGQVFSFDRDFDRIPGIARVEP